MKFSITLLLIVIILIIGIVSFYVAINPKAVVTQLENIIHAQTKYVTNTSGKIRLVFLPTLAIHIEKLTLTEEKSPAPAIVFKNISLKTPWKLSNLRSGNWHLSVKANEAYFKNTRATNFSLEIFGKENTIRFDDIKADYYSGKLTGQLFFNKKPSPIWQWQFDGNHINVNPFLHDLAQKNSYLNLNGYANFHFAGTRTKERDNPQPTVNGSFQFNMMEGSVIGIDLDYFIEKGIAFLKQEKFTKTPQEFTAFDKLSGSGDILENVAKSHDILLQTKTLTAKIAGEFALIDKTMDISLQLTPNNNNKLIIPLLITGSIDKPNIKLDTLLLQTMLTKEDLHQIKIRVQKVLDDLPERASKLIDKLLND